MRQVSSGFIEASLSPVGYADAYITINGTRINASSMKEISIQENIGESGAFSIGSFNTSEISVSVLTSSLPNLVTGVPINAYFGYYVGNAYEYVPMGTFYAQPKDVTTQSLFTTIKGYDRSIRLTDTYTSSLNWSNTHTVAQVLSEIQSATSLTMGAYGGLAPSSVTVYEKPQGSHRDVLRQMAILMGTNAKLNRTGALDFIKAYPSTAVQSYGAYNYKATDFRLTSNSPISFGKLTVNYKHTVSGEEVTDTFIYTAGSGSNTITLETANVRTQAKTNTLGQAIYGTSGLSYYGYSANLPGQPQIDLGDTIKIEDVFGNEYNLLVMSAVHTFNGALKTTFSATANEQDPTLDGSDVGATLTEKVGTINDAASYAVGKAEYAATKADEATASAEQAAQSASQAAQSASQASASASSASQSASQAATSASNAETSASSAAASASSAAADAENANYYANSALTELGIVEDVIGTLDWISQHATYKASTDTTVTGGKYYFTRSGTAPNYTYTVVTNPTGNPSAKGYYEIDSIDEAVSNYVGTHLALTNEGLWVQNDTNAYKILLSSTGMKVYDPQGALVSTFGESITFSANRVQTIGNSNSYVKFDPANGGSLTINGSTINITSNKTLDEVLDEKLDSVDVSVTQTSSGADITVNGDTVSISNGANGERGGRILKTTTAPSAYTTTVGSFTPAYRIALSTVKTQSGSSDVIVGDVIEYSYYHYPVGYVDASYVYTTARQSIRGATGTAGKWYSGTGITGTSTTATIFPSSGVTSAVVGDMYLNTETGFTYRCTTAGNANTAKWVYTTNITGPEAVVMVYPTAIDWSAGTATLAVTLRVDGAVITPTSYVWTKDTSTSSLGTSSTLTVTDLDAVYNCTVSWT